MESPAVPALNEIELKLEEQTEKAFSLSQQVDSLTDEVAGTKALLAEAQSRREAAESRQAHLEKSKSDKEEEQIKAIETLKQGVRHPTSTQLFFSPQTDSRGMYLVKTNKMVEVQQQAAASQQRVTELETEVDELNNQIATLKVSEKSAHSKLGGLAQDIEKANATIAQLQKDKVALQSELEKARAAAASAASVDNTGQCSTSPSLG